MKTKKAYDAPVIDVPKLVRETFVAPAFGQAMSILFAFLFLWQCMILPLVGKAAVQGSNSPGAGPMDTLWKNHLFFTVMLLVTILVGAIAVASKLKRRQTDQSPFPVFSAGLLAVAVLLLVVYMLGLLQI